MRRGLVYWIDRALGAHIVPSALTRYGVNVVRYTDTYPDDDALADVVWIPEIARKGWVIVTKDKNIRRNPAELEAIRAARAIYVCLGGGSLSGDDQAAYLVANWRTLDGFIASKRRGPLILTVRKDAVMHLDGEEWRQISRKRDR